MSKRRMTQPVSEILDMLDDIMEEEEMELYQDSTLYVRDIDEDGCAYVTDGVREEIWDTNLTEDDLRAKMRKWCERRNREMMADQALREWEEIAEEERESCIEDIGHIPDPPYAIDLEFSRQKSDDGPTCIHIKSGLSEVDWPSDLPPREVRDGIRRWYERVKRDDRREVGEER